MNGALLALIVSAAAADFQVVVDSSLTNHQAGAWGIYALTLVQTPGFEGEVLGRENMLDHRAELLGRRKARQRPGPDAYLDTLATVRAAGFLREYVWVFLRQPGWDVPPGLRLPAFTTWKAEHLRDHQAETWARLDRPPVHADEVAAQELYERAQRAYDAGRPNEAVVSASAALELHADHADALWVRALSLLILLGATTDEDARERLAHLGSLDLTRVVQLAPDSTRAAIVLDAYGPEPGLRLRRPTCPAEAITAFEEAEVHFGKRDYAAALLDYDRGLAACPDDATAWVYAGDALHGQSDLRGAVARYDRAIEVDRCHWQAHRFRGDVLMDVDPPQARRSYALAIACNPGYEAAWAHLTHVERVQLARPRLVDGTPALDRTGAPAGLQDVYDAWLSVWSARVAATDPDADFVALKAAVDAYRTARPDGGSAGPERAEEGDWDALRRADDAGFLREAMYVHLFGPDWIVGFVPWRDANLDRLVTYLESQVIAPF